LFATRLIPRGTVTWAADAFDQILSPEKLASVPDLLKAQAHRYSYVNGGGDRILCWDHGRFVNHSCAATCLSPGFDFEIAVRDIEAGEELTDDYGTLNPEEPFACLCGSANCRGQVLPEDPEHYGTWWDALVAEAFPAIAQVSQPLWDLVKDKDRVARVLAGELKLPSVLSHYRAPTRV
jgi:hypothetical protein